MIKEKFSVHEKEYTINITNNAIDSTRSKNISKTGFRAIKDGIIGTASAIGSYDEEKMWTAAINNLENKIPYDIESSSSNIKKHISTGNLTMNNDQFYSEVEIILSTLKEKYPDLIFSNKAIMNTTEVSFSNNNETDLKHSMSAVSIGFIFKRKSSTAIMDGSISRDFEDYSREEFLNYAYTMLDGFLSPECKLESGTYPVIFSTFSSILHTFLGNLNCDMFMSGASLFSNKKGEKAFNENFSLHFNTSPGETTSPFFDAEGSFNENFKFNLIENGVIKTPYTSKAEAKKFKLPHTCSAFGKYDDIPSASPDKLSVFGFKKTHESLDDIIKDQKAILVLIAAGSSYTPDGSFGAPVQVSLLMENGKIIGKLPEFSLSSNVFEMFGANFRGVCPDYFINSKGETLTVIDMDITL